MPITLLLCLDKFLQERNSFYNIPTASAPSLPIFKNLCPLGSFPTRSLPFVHYRHAFFQNILVMSQEACNSYYRYHFPTLFLSGGNWKVQETHKSLAAHCTVRQESRQKKKGPQVQPFGSASGGKFIPKSSHLKAHQPSHNVEKRLLQNVGEASTKQKRRERMKELDDKEKKTRIAQQERRQPNALEC